MTKKRKSPVRIVDDSRVCPIHAIEYRKRPDGLYNRWEQHYASVYEEHKHQPSWEHKRWVITNVVSLKRKPKDWNVKEEENVL